MLFLRDGLDDRDRLKWMIHRNGGTVDYDLPVAGPASGAIGPRTTWYVLADDPSRRFFLSKPRTPVAEQAVKVIKQARLDGVRPLPLKRLLAFLRGKVVFGPDL